MLAILSGRDAAMSSILIVLVSLAAAAPPQESPADVPSPKVAVEKPAAESPDAEAADGKTEHGISVEKSMRKRTGRELLEAVRETQRRLARPKNEDLEAAIEELLFVHQELLADKEMAISHRADCKKRVEFRLEQLSMDLKKRIARNKRLGKPKPPETIRREGEQLAQRVAGPAVAPARPPLVAGGYTGAAGGRMPNDDYGQQLVDLIQATIAPTSWDVNGGLGTIHYWRPGRALVIRQTGAVHEETRDVLGQLRRAGP
jgi:hypothetical protein